MAVIGFTNSFTGVRVNCRGREWALGGRTALSLRCEMGDSVAPKIRLVDTKSDATSKIFIEWETLYPNASEAVTVTSNTALNIALRSRTRGPSSAGATMPLPVPEGMSAADFYFPKEYRNSAPFIDLASRNSISVEMKFVNPTCGGYEANEAGSTAFWKKRTPESDYTPPESVATNQEYDEPLNSEEYERYFPTKVRNRAPVINMRGPTEAWRKMPAFLEVGNSYVKLNTKLASQLTVTKEGDEPDVRASATVAKYFEKDMHYAPDISIQGDEQVSFGLTEVPLPMSEASRILADYTDRVAA